MVSFERVFEVLDAPEPITERPGAIDLTNSAGEIAFNSVTFRYPAAEEYAISSMEQRSIPEQIPTATSSATSHSQSRLVRRSQLLVHRGQASQHLSH